MTRGTTENERALLRHVGRWGSAGYPIRKVGRRHWVIDHAAANFPVVHPTKREAVAQLETYLDMLHDAHRAEQNLAAVTS